MTADFPLDSLFVQRHRLWRLVEWSGGDGDGRAMTGAGRPVQPGEVIHRAVFKGDRLESRGTYTVKPGDAEWRDTGLVSTFPLNHGQPIFLNRFVGGPKWLREVF